MKVGALILAVGGLALTGCCASHKPATTSATADASLASQRQYEDASASALVFDPPVTVGETAPQLDRDVRQPSAFIGFDGPITTYYWIHTDDSQVSDWGNGGGGSGKNGGVGDRYERRAVIDRTGVTYR